MDDEEIPFRFYRPQKSDQNSPVIIYAHGGGWVYGDLEIYDKFCRRFANRTESFLFSVDYRLAPQHKLPTAIMDFQSVYEWILDRKENFGLGNQPILFAGDSSGGNIAAALVCKLIRERKKQPDKLILIYPVLDLTFPYSGSMCNNYLLTKEIMHCYRDQYLPTTVQHDDWLASPLFFDELDQFPETVIVSAECDFLSEGSYQLVKMLKKNQIVVAHQCYPGLLHGFMNCHAAIPEAEMAFRSIAEQL